MKTNIIIIAIVVIAVVIVGAFAAITMTTNIAQPQNNVTVNGSKITVVNNNNQVWAHWDLVVENATLKNGTKQTFYMEVWIKPGENTTIDLSNMLGYGNAPLPANTTLRILGWGGVYNNTASGSSKFDTTFIGWTTKQPPITNDLSGYTNPLHVDPILPVGPLPSGITNSTVFIGTSPESVGPEDSDTYEQLFTEIIMATDPSGVPHFRFGVIPTLCSTIAHIM